MFLAVCLQQKGCSLLPAQEPRAIHQEQVCNINWLRTASYPPLHWSLFPSKNDENFVYPFTLHCHVVSLTCFCTFVWDLFLVVGGRIHSHSADRLLFICFNLWESVWTVYLLCNDASSICSFIHLFQQLRISPCCRCLCLQKSWITFGAKVVGFEIGTGTRWIWLISW